MVNDNTQKHKKVILNRTQNKLRLRGKYREYILIKHGKNKTWKKRLRGKYREENIDKKKIGSIQSKTKKDWIDTKTQLVSFNYHIYHKYREKIKNCHNNVNKKENIAKNAEGKF